MSPLRWHLVLDFVVIFLSIGVLLRYNHLYIADFFEEPEGDSFVVEPVNSPNDNGYPYYTIHPHSALRTEYPFALVADLDLNSRDPNKFKWHSFLKKGTLKRLPSGNFTIEWNEQRTLYSSTATNNRSMELSELIKWNKLLLTMCDYTGIVYKITPTSDDLFQRYAIADGNGNQAKPFKAEWATLKNGYLYIGSIGKEWVRDGKVLHYDPEWIKRIDSCGTITNYDWGTRYRALRKAANCSYPGYLIHEAVVYHQELRKWLFLPRKASENEIYTPEAEESHGANLLLIADDKFEHIEVKRIGPLEPHWGFTSMKLIPETNEIMALKVYEVQGETKTMITIFDLDGNFKLEPHPWMSVSDEIKFEGLEFI